MDAALHRERLQGRCKRLHVPTQPIEELPDGAMIAADGGAWLTAGGRPHHWSPAGYEALATLMFVDGLLTPPSTLAALMAGYRPTLHPSWAETSSSFSRFGTCGAGVAAAVTA
jgi:hypothetical protein